MKHKFTGHTLALIAISLLMVWMLVWLGFLTQADMQQRILWLVLALLPLAIVGFFLWRNSKAGSAWCGFIALGYFAQGVTVVLTSRSDAGFASVEIFLSLLLFTAAGMALRAHRQDL